MTGETPDWLKGAKQRKIQARERERLRLTQEEEERQKKEERRINTYSSLADSALVVARAWEDLNTEEALKDIADFMELKLGLPKYFFSRSPKIKSDSPGSIMPDSRHDLKRLLADESWVDPIKSRFLYVEQQIGKTGWRPVGDDRAGEDYWVCKLKFQLTPTNFVIKDGQDKILYTLGESRTPDELRQKLGQFVADLYP
jgi:hypothetical protein